METIRSEVASSWRIVADNNEWQCLFQHLLANFLVADQPTSGAAGQITSKKPDMTNNVNKGVLGSLKQPNTKIAAVATVQNKNSNPVKKKDGNCTMTPQTKTQFQIKSYLARIGLTYDIFQKQHRKHSSLNKSYFCHSGGFVKLQQSLQNRILPKCPVCEEILKVKGFSFEELEQQEHAPLMEHTNSSLVKNEKREHIEIKVESSAKKQKLDVLQVVKQDKHFLILEPGTKGKRFPVQCLICSRSAHAKSTSMQRGRRRLRMKIQSFKWKVSFHSAYAMVTLSLLAARALSVNFMTVFLHMQLTLTWLTADWLSMNILMISRGTSIRSGTNLARRLSHALWKRPKRSADALTLYDVVWMIVDVCGCLQSN